MNYFEAKQNLIELNNAREHNTHPLSVEYYDWQYTFESKVFEDKLDNVVVTTSRQTGRTICALALAIHKATEEQRKIIFLVDRPVVIDQLKYDIKYVCKDALKNIKFRDYKFTDKFQDYLYKCMICDLMPNSVNCCRESCELDIDEKFIFQECTPEVQAW